MHCNISEGNYLLTRDQEEGPSFLSDLEFARRLDTESPQDTILVCTGMSVWDHHIC
jgi:hypothetical protein